MDPNTRYDCITALARQHHLPCILPRGLSPSLYRKWASRYAKPPKLDKDDRRDDIPEKRPRKPANPPVRPSHLKARQRFPTHPFTKYAKAIKTKLPTMAELEALDHEELAGVFLKHCRKFIPPKR